MAHTKRTNKKAVTVVGKWKPVFLATLAETGIVGEAIKSAMISRATAFTHRKTDKAFAKGWKCAISAAADLMEKEARRRAVDGTEKPVFYLGKECGRIQEYSDTLLIFLLKGARPKKFRENLKVENTGTTKYEYAVTVHEMMKQVLGSPETFAAAEALNARLRPLLEVAPSKN